MPPQKPNSVDADMLYASGGNSKGEAGGSSDWNTEFENLAGDLENRFGFKREYAHRQLSRESGGNRKARSWAGAQGLMQLMPGTAKRYGVTDPNDPIQNIRGWHGYMSDLLEMFGGDSDKALAAYNAGEGAVLKQGLERVRKFSNLPKGDPRRGTEQDKTTTGHYVDKIKGLDDIRALNQQLTRPITISARPKGAQLPPSRTGADMEYAAKNSSQVTQAAPVSSPSPFGEISGGAQGIKEQNRGIVSKALEFASGPGMGIINPMVALAPESTRRNFVVGGANAAASMLRGAESAYLHAKYPVTAQIFDNLPAGHKPSVGQFVMSEIATDEQGRVHPNTPIGLFRQSVEQGVGSMAVQLPALAAGAPFEAANLPLQMGITGMGEGPEGAAKGAALGMVYHFGMGFTAPLGRVANALIWGADSTVEGLIEGQDLGSALGSGFTMGALSASGPQKVRIKTPEGIIRNASIRDLISIQKGTVEILPPIEVNVRKVRDIANSGRESGVDIKVQGYYSDTTEQADLRYAREQHLSRAEELKSQRLNIQDNNKEATKDPIKLKEEPKEVEELTGLREIETAAWAKLEGARGQSNKVLLHNEWLAASTAIKVAEAREYFKGGGEYLDASERSRILNANTPIEEFDSKENGINASIIKDRGLLEIKSAGIMESKIPDGEGWKFDEKGRVNFTDEDVKTLSTNLNALHNAMFRKEGGLEASLGMEAKSFFRTLGRTVEQFLPHEKAKFEQAEDAYHKKDFSTASLLTEQLINTMHSSFPMKLKGEWIVPRRFKLEKSADNERYAPDDLADIDPSVEEKANAFLAAAKKTGRLTPYFQKLFSENTPPEIRLNSLQNNPRFSELSDDILRQLSYGSLAEESLSKLVAETLGTSIEGTNLRLVESNWNTPRVELDRLAKSAPVIEFAQSIENIFSGIHEEVLKYHPSFENVQFGGIEIGPSGTYGFNRGGGAYKDGNNKIYINLHNEIGAINALEQLGYIPADKFSKYVATHTIETIYHELTHQVPIESLHPKEGENYGHEGHSPEFDSIYTDLLHAEADNVIKYRDQLQKVLERNNEQITNAFGQQANELGVLDRLTERLAGAASDPFNNSLSRGRIAKTSAIAGGSRKLGGFQWGADAPGRPESGIHDAYPLYRGINKERLVEWAKKRSENLDRFMGERSIFRREDGEYTPLFHGTGKDFVEFQQGDIGIHAGTSEAANWRNVAKENVYVKGDGYERYVLNQKESQLGKTNRWSRETVEARPGTAILPVFMKLENPARIADVDSHSPRIVLKELVDKGHITPEESAQVMRDANESGKKGKFVVAEQFEQMRRLLESKGFDGLVYENIFEGAKEGQQGQSGSDSYVVFRSEQVKSAIGNSGEYDPHSPNILHSSDPVSLAVKSAIETGKVVYKLSKSFVDWSRSMIAHYGPGIKLHLENIWEAVVRFHQNEKGFIDLGAKKFYEDDIAPAAKSTAHGIYEAWDTIRRTFAPAGRGPLARETGGMLRHRGSELWLKFFRAEAALEDARVVLDKLTTPDRWKFIDDIEAGSKQSNPNLQPLADQMRRLLDEGRYSVQNLGTGKLQNFYQNYFPHIWKDPARAQQLFAQMLMGKRPLAGKKSFLKQRTHLTFADGLKAGLEPVSENPVDLVLLKLHEVNKYVMGQQVMHELKARGIAKYVKSSQIEAEKLNGFMEVNDSIFSVFGGPSSKPQGGQLLRGKYMLPEQAARVINNHLSPGLRKNAAFRGYMALANTLNQFQLGWSFFHGGFTTIDAMISKMALGHKYLAAGNPVKALESYLRSNPITAPIENVIRGHQVLNEAMHPGSSPQYADIIQKLTAGGFRPKMEKIYTNDMVHKFKEALRSGNYPGALWRGPLALTEAIAHPVLEWLVPRQKLGVAADMVRFELDRDPNMNIYDQRIMIGKVVDSVDNRLGQMTYDNLFWNRVGKDLMMFTFRSVGWNLGTKREVGGGMLDIAKMPIDAVRGKPVEFTHRSAYVVALPIYAAMLGAVVQYLYTGSGPQELKDYFFPRTGNTDERGNPERVNLPTYIKDLYHYRDLYKVGPHSRKTFVSKLHPALSLIGDMLQNEDYFGVEIANEDDPFLTQQLDRAKFLGKSVLPFGIQNFSKERERGASPAKSLIPILTGITPAPSDINQTKAEEELYLYNQKVRPTGTRTKAQAERTQALVQIRKAILKKDGTADEKMKAAVDNGIMTPDDISEIIKNLAKQPIQIRFGSTSPEEAIKVWNLMNDAEKGLVKDLMQTKTRKVLELPPAQRDGLLPKYQKAVEYYIGRRQE